MGHLTQLWLLQGVPKKYLLLKSDLLFCGMIIGQVFGRWKIERNLNTFKTK